MYNDLLHKLGFSDKAANVYLELLSLGPSSVRKLAESCDLNRGTTYDTLKWLQERGLVTFYQKETRQYFVAENPEKLLGLAQDEEEKIHDTLKRINKTLPELQAVYNRGGERPVARYYEKDEIVKVLTDVLESCEESGEPVYRIYSAEGIREYLYEGFETFSDVRVAKGIGVKAIAIGKGGELRGLDERKWIQPQNETQEAYVIIYPGKTAYISLNAKQEPVGVVIENEGLFEMQKIIFDSLWTKI